MWKNQLQWVHRAKFLSIHGQVLVEMRNQLHLLQRDCFQNNIPDTSVPSKYCSNKAFMCKITSGIWDFESISREGTVREKGIQGVVYEERWIRHSKSQISSIWLRYFASYFQINFLQVNKIITFTGDFKFKHWSIRWIDRSNFLIESVFQKNQKRVVFQTNPENYG